MRITLKIGDKELLCSLGLGFLGELLDSTGLSIDEVVEKLNKNPFKTVPLLIYHSAKYGAESKELTFTMSLSDIIDLIDDNGGLANPEVTRFLQTWTKSMTKDVPVEEALGEEGTSQKK